MTVLYQAELYSEKSCKEANNTELIGKIKAPYGALYHYLLASGLTLENIQDFF